MAYSNPNGNTAPVLNEVVQVTPEGNPGDSYHAQITSINQNGTFGTRGVPAGHTRHDNQFIVNRAPFEISYAGGVVVPSAIYGYTHIKAV